MIKITENEIELLKSLGFEYVYVHDTAPIKKEIING